VFTAPSVYPIVDTDVCERHGILPEALANACLRGGAAVLQVRSKGGSSAALLALARRLVGVASTFNAAVIVNDRADIAVIARAAGVHVGQDDLSVEEAQRIAGGGLVVGVSTHTREQVDAALSGGAAYIAVGPIYETATKDTGYGARGLDLVRYASGRGLPVVAIGGITLERAPDVMAAGASAVALISDLLTAGDPERRVRQYVRALR
jgi:thiamine-phosphate pyrophosphorylase